MQIVRVINCLYQCGNSGSPAPISPGTARLMKPTENKNVMAVKYNKTYFCSCLFTAVSSMRSNHDPNSCILVEDAKVVAADEQMARDSTASIQTPTEGMPLFK